MFKRWGSPANFYRWTIFFCKITKTKGSLCLVYDHRTSLQLEPTFSRRQVYSIPVAPHEVVFFLLQVCLSKPYYFHLRQACGENLRGYGNRMDSMWSLRAAYTEAMKIKLSQDEYCANAENGLWNSLSGPFPDDLRWEMLVDVLRGRVKVSLIWFSLSFFVRQ